MNSESKINVHYSSLVGLKAELLRKQTEVEQAKAKLVNAQPIKKLKTENKKSKKKQKKKEKKEIEPSEDIECMSDLKKSKLMLQAKSRLYEKLSKTRTNMNPNFLVDFEHKPDHSDYSDHSEKEIQKEDDCYSDHDSDSEWVEYTDCFGRTRKCLREDLPKMKEKDEYLQKNVVEKSRYDNNERVPYVEDRTPMKEPEIEIMRRKWEEQTEKLAQKVDIHYQDVLFDEARTHGVGYFAFSQDEKERAKQQENLINLRKETEQKQKENEAVRDMKERMQQNRLKVARLRQRIRAGLPAEDIEEEMASNNSTIPPKSESDEKQESNKDVDSNSQNKELGNKTSETEKIDKEETARKDLKDIENKIEAFGELLGKRNRWYVMSQEEWVEKKRNERPSEFAPKYQNFKPGGSLKFNNSTKRHNPISHNLNESSDSNDSDIIGPLPPSQNNSSITEPIPSSIDDSDIIGPMPPSIIETSTSQNKVSTTGVNTNITDTIEAGLKFLRQEFENKHS